jgi:hypothetical protein
MQAGGPSLKPGLKPSLKPCLKPFRKPHRNTLLSVFFDPMDLIRLVNFKNPVA